MPAVDAVACGACEELKNGRRSDADAIESPAKLLATVDDTLEVLIDPVVGPSDPKDRASGFSCDKGAID